MIILLRIISFIAVIIVVLLAGLFFFQERLIFFPSKMHRDFAFKFKNSFEEKWIRVGGDEIHSLFFQAKDSPGIVLYFHGNGGALDSWGDLGSDFVEQTGWSIWMVDYPGYGKSSGAITSEEQLHDMASAIFSNVKQLSDGKKIVVYGRSLGSGIASRLAAMNAVDGVVLETPYFNGTQLAKVAFPFVPSFIVRYKLPSNEWVKKIKSPVLVVHGTADEVVPYSQGQGIFGEINARKEFLRVDGGHHNNLPSYSEYWKSLKTFLNGL